MEGRINVAKLNPGGYKLMYGFAEYLAKSSLDKKLIDLIHLRVSQINGCAYCLDMHWKDLKAEGESDQRLYSLDAWRETTFYSERERAALTWAEATTNIQDGHVSDEVFDQVRAQFSEQELADLVRDVRVHRVLDHPLLELLEHGHELSLLPHVSHRPAQFVGLGGAEVT